MLVDRLAILLVMCNAKYPNTDDWNPMGLDRTYDEEGSLGDEIRDWPQYNVARKVINNWLNKIEAEDE